MRTTVRIDDDIMLNRVVRAGLSADRSTRSRKPFRQDVFDLGQPAINLDKALAIAGTLEDDEIARKLSLRK